MSVRHTSVDMPGSSSGRCQIIHDIMALFVRAMAGSHNVHGMNSNEHACRCKIAPAGAHHDTFKFADTKASAARSKAILPTQHGPLHAHGGPCVSAFWLYKRKLKGAGEWHEGKTADFGVAASRKVGARSASSSWQVPGTSRARCAAF